jgi:hypothetical protein
MGRQLERKIPRPYRQATREPARSKAREHARPDVAMTVAPRRRAQRLRRSFPPLEPEREAILRERNRAAFEYDPCRAELERRLLDLGGTLALLFLPDSHVGELLDRGRYFPGARALMQLGEPSACHANSAMMFVRSKGAVWIASGYALSADGLWRQHSWGVDADDGRVLETTDRRVRYFGILLNDCETLLRPLAVVRSGHLWPEEASEVRRFIRKNYGRRAERPVRIDRPRSGRTRGEGWR